MEAQIWDALLSAIGNPVGAAAVMGNLYAESGLNPGNLQDSFEKKLGMTDEEYTRAVDECRYIHFADDGAGYGLAQWTYGGRKRGLLEYARSLGASIGDIDMQLGYLLNEIADMPELCRALMDAADIRAASDRVMLEYERPADTGEAARAKRAGYAREYYDKYAGVTGMKKTLPCDRLIAVAEGEEGYLEKRSNSNLDSKTGNAGSGNYTKYNRDLLAWAKVGYIAAQWCQAFVDWCFIVAFGVEAAKLLLGVFTNYTPEGSDAFKKKGRYIRRGKGTPKRGDVIYFWSSSKGRIGHVGIVLKVTAKKVYTIEGNTSGASALVTNGGGVRKKSYSLSSTYIDGYGSVDWSVLGEAAEPAGLQPGDAGAAVKAMQEKLLKWDAKCLPKYGADGDYGSETRAAVKAFQAFVRLPATGICDAATLAALGSLGAKTVVITGGAVNVRSTPSTLNGKNILGVVKQGTKLRWLGSTETIEREWFMVEYEGRTAYVSGKLARAEASAHA